MRGYPSRLQRTWLGPAKDFLRQVAVRQLLGAVLSVGGHPALSPSPRDTSTGSETRQLDFNLIGIVGVARNAVGCARQKWKLPVSTEVMNRKLPPTGKGKTIMATRQNRSVAITLPAPKPVEVNDLYLDPQNPRLAGLELTLDQQDEIIKVLWEDRAVNELVDSIASSGYWEHEVLFAAKEAGRLVVIEGNRRLAAVKLLRDEQLRNRIGVSGLPSLTADARKKLEALPVIECKREDVWQYIGFKHVNGPQDWDSIAKAQYIARVHNEYGIPLDEIARTIGDRHDTVRRLYRGLMVLDQAEKTGAFDREDRWNSRFAYSHLWTGLGYANVQEFLGITTDKGFEPNPVPKTHLDDLKQLCLWLYGSKKLNKEPVIRSQNPDLRSLDEVLGSKNGIAALRSGLPLDTSLKASRGDERLLREAMVVAEQKLKEARGLVLTGYTGDSDLLSKARAISTIADNILQEMDQMAATAQHANGPKARKRGRS
jgi:hypothetical protein